MHNVADAVFEATGNNELAARISLLIKPLRFSELDDDESSIYGGEDHGQV